MSEFGFDIFSSLTYLTLEFNYFRSFQLENELEKFIFSTQFFIPFINLTSFPFIALHIYRIIYRTLSFPNISRDSLVTLHTKHAK